MITHAVQHDPTVGEQIFTNPDSESLWMYTAYSSPTVAINSAEKHNGAYSVRVQTTATASQGLISCTQRVFGPNPNPTTPWQAQAWVKGPAGRTVAIEARFTRANLGNYLQGAGYRNHVLTGDWLFITSYPFALSPTTPDICCVSMEIRTSGTWAVGESFYIDETRIYRVA